jgi:parvulin-like peptidyl-prolyl isomerase
MARRFYSSLEKLLLLTDRANCLNRLVPHLCGLLLVAGGLACGDCGLRAAQAQQPAAFGPPGANYAAGGISAPVVPNNPTSFGPGNRLPAVPNSNPAAPIATTAPPTAGSQPVESQIVPLEGGQIIARVGGQIIVAGDILPRVNQVIKEQLAKMPAEQRAQIPPEEIEKAKHQFMQRELLSLLETKLLFEDAKRTIPKDNFPKVLEKLDEQFDKVEMPHLLEEANVNSRLELDQKFIQQGSSLMQQKRAFSERLLATEWLKQHIDFRRAITHDEMLAYYHEHLADYEFEAKAKFEELMVRFDRFPNKGAAYAALAALGNQLISGANLAELAKANSHGPTARDGGQYGFVSRGSLVLPILNEAVFTLPVGQLSQILESENGFHNVRVQERTDAGRTPFEDTQEEISKKLQRTTADKQIKEYLARLRRETRVWTIFDGPLEQQAMKSE